MNKGLATVLRRPPLRRFLLSGLAICVLGSLLPPALAQDAGNVDPTQSRDWAPGAIGHAQKMRSHKDADQGSQTTGEPS